MRKTQNGGDRLNMKYKDDDYTNVVNKTYSQYFSTRQILPKFIINRNHKRYLSVLDYGAGKHASGTQMLRTYFIDVTAYDIGNNCTTCFHNENALDGIYDIVMASNVINVQPSLHHVSDVFHEIKNCLTPNGIVYCNLPRSPRKCEINEQRLQSMMENYFNDVVKHNANIYSGVNHVKEKRACGT